MEFVCFAYFLVFLLSAQHTIPTTLKLEPVMSPGTNMTMLKQMDQARQQSLLTPSFPLLGSTEINSYGLYFAKVKLGSPPKEFSLKIDTKSDITWVSCNPCYGCPTSSGFGIPLTLYDPQRSSSAHPVLCEDRACYASKNLTKTTSCSQPSDCSYRLSYGDNTECLGFLVSDLVHFDTNFSAPFSFGCSDHLYGGFSKPDMALDGILGLGLNYPSMIQQMALVGMPKVFSHCLRDGGGTLVFGEVHEAGIQYTPLVPHQPHYFVNLESIAINGEKILVDPAAFTLEVGGTIVDSGTSLGMLAPAAFNSFIYTLNNSLTKLGQPISFDEDLCFQLSIRITDVLPLISFNFKGGASMILKPENYLRRKDDHTWCLGFQKGRSATVLGDIVLKNKIIVYDLEHFRLGWVDFNCSHFINVSTKPYRSSSSLSVDSNFKSILISSAAIFFFVTMIL